MTERPTTDLSVLERLTRPAGREVVDIGCGGGAFVRELSSRGARVTGVEISEAQLAPARARDGAGDARYLVGRAERLPLDDASVDVAIFMRTLHHVPIADQLMALREARRVLRPDGCVCVVEPLAQGDFFALTQLVDDELEVRAAAQRTIAQSADAGLRRDTTLDYDTRLCFAGVDALRAQIVSVDPDRAVTFDARRAEITAVFARLGEPGEGPGERCFVQPTRADLLRPAVSPD